MRSLVSEATICRLVHKMFRFYSLGHRSVTLLWYNASGFEVKNSINRNLQDGGTYGRIDTKMFMGNYRLI